MVGEGTDFPALDSVPFTWEIFERCQNESAKLRALHTHAPYSSLMPAHVPALPPPLLIIDACLRALL